LGEVEGDRSVADDDPSHGVRDEGIFGPTMPTISAFYGIVIQTF
jgi:hypothetical protein